MSAYSRQPQAQQLQAQQQHQPQQQQSFNATPAQLHQAQDELNTVHEISSLLQTGLSREQLSVCIALMESGANPEAVAAIVKELKREAQDMAQQQ